MLFVIQADGVTATTVVADLGENALAISFASSDASTTTGLSGIQLDSSTTAVTASYALRLIDIVQDGANEDRSGTDTSNVIVLINQGAHAYASTSVVATA